MCYRTKSLNKSKDFEILVGHDRKIVEELRICGFDTVIYAVKSIYGRYVKKSLSDTTYHVESFTYTKNSKKPLYQEQFTIDTEKLDLTTSIIETRSVSFSDSRPSPVVVITPYNEIYEVEDINSQLILKELTREELIDYTQYEPAYYVLVQNRR